MAIGRFLSEKSREKFVIPCAGKMFRANMSEKNKAVCFCLNKGYLEVTDLSLLLNITDALEEVVAEDTGTSLIILVGKPDKVRLRVTGKVVYRQRIFFKSLTMLLSVLYRFGVRLEVTNGFRVTINNIIGCSSDLCYFERYAAEFDETIDTWLTNTCLVHLHRLLVQMRHHSELGIRVADILNGKLGYLDRAPFLALGYDLEGKTSSVFIGGSSDSRAYSVASLDVDRLDFGYTSENLSKDKDGGVFA